MGICQEPISTVIPGLLMALLTHRNHSNNAAAHTPRRSKGVKDRLGKPIEFNYRPFFDKPLMQDRKLRQLLQAERAAHCLVFHKHGHLLDSHTFRPDLNIQCSDPIAPGQNGLLVTSTATNKNHNMVLLEPYGTTTQRSNIQRLDEINNHEHKALREFWNDAELVHGLESNHLHQQYLVLQRELREQARVTDELNSCNETLADMMARIQNNW